MQYPTPKELRDIKKSACAVDIGNRVLMVRLSSSLFAASSKAQLLTDRFFADSLY